MTRQGGFTLLEVLVALTIMAMSLGLIYRASGSSARNTIELERAQGAIVLAESLRDLRDSVSELGWNEEGASAGYRWQTRSTPFDTGVRGNDVPLLHQIHITVAWQDGERTRHVEVDTLLPERKPLPVRGRP